MVLSRHSSVFGICDLLQSCRSRRETIIGIFQILQNLNSDLNSDFQYEIFNFRLLPGTHNLDLKMVLGFWDMGSNFA